MYIVGLVYHSTTKFAIGDIIKTRLSSAYKMMLL